MSVVLSGKYSRVMYFIGIFILLALFPLYTAAACQSSNCLQCNDTSVCNVCNDGYYLEAGSCKQCLTYCATCTNSTQCQTCLDKYFYPELQCRYACYSECGEAGCNDTTGYCYECSPGMFGLYCNRNCSLCVDGDCERYVCTKGCIDGYYYAHYFGLVGKCMQCPTNCATCTNSSHCQTCLDKYYYPKSKCRYVCRSGCTDAGCNDTTGYCYECKPGMYGTNCHFNCSQCVEGHCDRFGCTKGCIDVYDFQSVSSKGFKYCHQCPSNCTSCSNTTYCTQCDQGYYGSYYRYPTSGRGRMKCELCDDQCTECTSIDKCPGWCPLDCIQQGCGSTSKSFGYGVATGSGIVIFIVVLIVAACFLIRRTQCIETPCFAKTTTTSKEQHVYYNTQTEMDSISNPSNTPDYVNADIVPPVQDSEYEINEAGEYNSLDERQLEHQYSDLQRRV